MQQLADRIIRSLLVVLAATAAPDIAADRPSRVESVPWSPPAWSTPEERLADQIVERERALSIRLEDHQPLVETYLQTIRPDPTLGATPIEDQYFLGRIQLASTEPSSGRPRGRSRDRLLSLVDAFYNTRPRAHGFARMMILDRRAFDRDHYDFEFVRREFLGEVRTLVFSVMPRDVRSWTQGRFTGNIWVEDRGYSIVRFNGVYDSVLGSGVHFDSWRLNLAPGLWLPAYVYTEETERVSRSSSVKHVAQTRIWGYSVGRDPGSDALTDALANPPRARRRNERPGVLSPVQSQRTWEYEAEENVLRRLQKAGLLAPEGEVDEVLETVVGNLELTNSLEIEPPVRCRVLLTTPLESFTVGHTIVLSRGLIDVLPDEASLAMVLAHELGHVLSGHRMDSAFAFSDRVLVGDAEAMRQFLFRRDPREEAEADERAFKLLQGSPYRDQLQNAGLFLKALAATSEALPMLIRPHFGNRMAEDDRLFRMEPLAETAPDLAPEDIEQIAALPLGSRVKVDPWSAAIELMQNNRVAMRSAREKLPFRVTPLMPHLVHYGARDEPRADRPTSRAAVP